MNKRQHKKALRYKAIRLLEYMLKHDRCIVFYDGQTLFMGESADITISPIRYEYLRETINTLRICCEMDAKQLNMNSLRIRRKQDGKTDKHA